MNRSVYITDYALVTGLGCGVDTVWQRLLAGESSIRAVDHFNTTNYLAKSAALVPDLPHREGESRLYPLLEQLLEQLDCVPQDAQLITATTKGAIDLLERDCLEHGHVVEADAVVPSAMTHWLARQLDIDARGTNINAACASSTLAIGRAAAMIAHGAAEVVVVCCADIVSEFVLSGFSALQALSDQPSRPFDRDRNGLTLGEGAAAVVMMSDDAAQRYHRVKHAEVCGWGAANDANHITAPARDGCGLIQTVEQTLKRADVSADDVSAISAHGTGTVYNDMMELTAFKAIFGERLLPISSIKGALGHTLGAAGGIEAVLAIASLNDQLVPPTCGVVNPEELAIGQVSASAQPFNGELLLSTNSGFGGVNAALLIRRGQQ